jgi:hypothetical protein
MGATRPCASSTYNMMPEKELRFQSKAVLLVNALMSNEIRKPSFDGRAPV